MTDTHEDWAPGPRDPRVSWPDVGEPTARRVGWIDVLPGDGFRHIRAVARDVVLAAGTRVVNEVEVTAELDAVGSISSISSSDGTDLSALVGEPVRSGFRAKLHDALEDHVATMSPLHFLLDDFPGAVLVSGYGDLRKKKSVEIAPENVEAISDICSGWATGATMLSIIDKTGVLPAPGVATAPSLREFGPYLFDAQPILRANESRRSRIIEVGSAGDERHVRAWYRDSHMSHDDQSEAVLHEYDIVAAISADNVVDSCEASARVLPWPECPQALASAGRAAGQRLGTLRAAVKAEFVGVTTCTHLNDVVRFLDDALALFAALDETELRT